MENTDAKKNNLLPADFKSPEQIAADANKFKKLGDDIWKSWKKIDEHNRQDAAGRTTQQHRYFLEVASELKKIDDLKRKKEYLLNEIEKNDFNITEAKIKKNKIEISYFEELNNIILEPELKKIDEKILALPKEQIEIKVQEETSNPIVGDTNEIAPTTLETNKGATDTKREKIICADKKLSDAIIYMLIEETKLVNEFFKPHLEKFLRSEEMTAKISWNGNKNICTSLFYMLLDHKKFNCSKQFLAESINSSFDFIKEGTNTDGSLHSILEDFKPNNSDRRIKSGSEYYARFEQLCS